MHANVAKKWDLLEEHGKFKAIILYQIMFYESSVNLLESANCYIQVRAGQLIQH